MRRFTTPCLLRATLLAALGSCPSVAGESAAVISPARKDTEGFLVHRVRSPYQSGETRIRVLRPAREPPDGRLDVLFLLPVEARDGRRYGDGLAEARRLRLADRYRVLCVAPTFSDLPWYADHATDPRIRQESYLLEVVLPFIERSYPVTRSAEGRWLVGFSKSGWGAFSLLLRHPERFGQAVAWDAPLMLERPDRYGAGRIFGTAENFEEHEIASLLRRRSDRLRGPPRLALLGYGNFREDHRALHALLEELHVPHVHRDGPKREHHWASGWLEEAVAVAAATRRRGRDDGPRATGVPGGEG